jgi:SAM-dependent methyltransferase
MHPSALRTAQLFSQVYCSRSDYTLVELGSQTVLGQPSLRPVFVGASRYIGLDCCEGDGVDVVMDDSYAIPLDDETADVVISSSCLEHADFFWISFLEMVRILKRDGILYINAPSNGEFHRHPVDCWRFYPDSGLALQKWARHNGMSLTMLESFTCNQQGDAWNDFVAVFCKGDAPPQGCSERIIDRISEFTNGRVYGNEDFLQPAVLSEDMARRRLAAYHVDYPTKGRIQWS